MCGKAKSVSWWMESLRKSQSWNPRGCRPQGFLANGLPRLSVLFPSWTFTRHSGSVDKTQHACFFVQRVRDSIPRLGRLVKITICCLEPPMGVTLSPVGSLANSCYPVTWGNLYGDDNLLQHVLQYPLSLIWTPYTDCGTLPCNLSVKG